VYVPAVVTVMAAVVAPVLHRNVAPVSPVAVRTELPQLFTTVTVGAGGIISGAAVPEPAGLIHPSGDVWVTVYSPATVTVIEAVVSPVLQRKVAPVTPVAVSTEFPQLFTTVTTGAAGITFGAAVPEPGRLVHPFGAVWVTV